MYIFWGINKSRQTPFSEFLNTELFISRCLVHLTYRTLSAIEPQFKKNVRFRVEESHISICIVDLAISDTSSNGVRPQVEHFKNLGIH